MERFLGLIFCLFLAACNGQSVDSVPKSAINSELPCVISAESEALSDPKNIEDAISLINSLPKPLNLECFLKSLKRPLYVNATSSKLSVQVGSPENPRIFIFKGNLVIAFIASGEGSHLLEFSELLSYMRSIKGEVKLPVEKDLAPSDPFIKILSSKQTTCNGCHKGEQEEYVLDGIQVYSSYAIQPTSGKNISLEDLNQHEYLCGFYKEDTQRCRILSALLSNGEVLPVKFPSGMPTFLQNIQL